MKRCKLFVFMVIGTLLWSCSPQPKNLEEFRAWFNDEQHGFIKERTIKELKFMAKYLPPEVMMLNELDENQLNQPLVDSLRQSYGNGRYFMFSIGLKDSYDPQSGDLLKNFANTIQEYQQNYESLAFELGKNFQLIVAGDTLFPNIYHYEQGAHLTSEQRFLVAFDDSGSEHIEPMTFIYQDELFQVGRLKFLFDVNNNIPSIPI